MIKELKDQSCVEGHFVPWAGHGPLEKSKKYWDSGFAFKDLPVPKQQDMCEKFNNNTRVKAEHKIRGRRCQQRACDSCKTVPPVPSVTGAETPESPGGAETPETPPCICGGKQGIRMLASTHEHFLDGIPSLHNNSARMNYHLLHHNFLLFSPEEKARKVNKVACSVSCS